jgi:hypothetical protein
MVLNTIFGDYNLAGQRSQSDLPNQYLFTGRRINLVITITDDQPHVKIINDFQMDAWEPVPNKDFVLEYLAKNLSNSDLINFINS